MWKNRLQHILLAALLCLLCAVLLMGFVPRGDRSQVRRPVNHTVVSAGMQPNTPQRPGAHGTSYSGRVSHHIRKQHDDASLAATDDMVFFSANGVALRTAHGTRVIEDEIRALGLMPLPSVDAQHSALLALAQLAGLPVEVLADNGQPLRFTAVGGGNACAVSPALFADRKPDRPLLLPVPSPEALAALPRHHFDTGSMFDRAKRYQALVTRFAARYSLDPALVYAIIMAESNFRPMLVSSQSAMGLMQLLPSTAGGEVHKYLHGSTTRVTLEDLANPETNIGYGTAYLHLLMNRHMAGIDNPLSRQYCAIASYNMGPNGFLRLFGSTREAAVNAINGMTPEELLQHLTTALPVRETRAFVVKVTRARQNFSEMVAQGE